MRNPLLCISFFGIAAICAAQDRPQIKEDAGTVISRADADKAMSLCVTKRGESVELRLQVVTNQNLGFKDFNVHIFDDQKEEVACVPVLDMEPFVGFGTRGWLAVSAFYHLTPKPGRTPTTARVLYQGKESNFTFKPEVQVK